jgi:putative membrane protein
VHFAAGKGSVLWRLFWGAFVGLIGFMIGVYVWDFAAQMLARNLWLGRTALALLALFCGALILLALKELAAFSRLRKIDALRKEAEDLLQTKDLGSVLRFQKRLERLYAGRADLRWAVAQLEQRRGEVLDVDAALALTENTLMRPLDSLASLRVEAASRQVATATAIIPLALADVVVAFSANLRMIRQIAQIYGGRTGAFGSWRLAKAVAAHLVATGAVAIGDDLVGSVAGGGVLSKISRRFGEGVINGALTARVGIAAMEVCRPMPFRSEPRPRVSAIIKRSLAGVFGT